MALFFLLLFILFFPLKFVFCVSFDLKQKILCAKSRFFNFVTVYNKSFALKKLLADKKGIIKKLSSKNKTINIKKLFKIKKLYFICVCNTTCDRYIFHAISFVNEYFFDLYDEKYRIYIRFDNKYKIIATEGIIYTSIAKIISNIIFSFGVWLCKTIKTKLKKSSMG